MSGMLALAAKSTLVLVAAAVAAIVMRKASASARHVVWAVAFAALLLLPSLTYVVPRWPVAVLPPVPHAAAPEPAPIEHESPALAPFAEEGMEPLSIEPLAAPPSAAAAAEPPPVRWDTRMALLYIWIAGAACGLLHLAIGTGLLGRRVRGATPVVDDEWQRALATAAAALHVRRTIRLRVSTEVAVPIVWGWLRPVVLIPVEAEDWPEERRRAFLLHEVAHVARFDCVTQTLASIVHSLYWPHPLAWWAMRRLRQEAERACDDRVLAAGTRAPDYAHHLLEAARGLTDSPRSFSPASAIVERTTLGDRLLALLDDRLSRRVPTARTLALLAALSLAATVAVAALQPVARAAMVQALDAVVAPLVASPAASPAPAPAAPEAAAAPRPIATAAPEPVLSGIVTGPDGKPIENALVLAWEPQGWIDPPRHTRTDAKGEFKLAVPGPSRYRLRVEAFPWAPQTFEDIGTRGRIAVTLVKGQTVEGVVRDEKTRRPIADARVRARSTTDFVAPFLPSEPDAGSSQAKTDKEGRFRIEGVSSSSHNVSAVAPGYGSAVRKAAANSTDVEVFLPAGAVLTGTVRGAHGKAVAGAMIDVQGELLARSNAPTTRSDDRGRFESLGLQPGRHRVVVRHPDWAAALLPDVEVKLGPNTPVEVTLEKGFRVTGRLVGSGDRAARGDVFVQTIDGVDAPGMLSRHLRSKARADGRFAIAGVPPGSHVLGVLPIGYVAMQVPAEVGGRNAVVEIGDIKLDAGLTVRGIVRNAKGPIAGATIATRSAGRSTRAESDPDGSFVLPGVEKGTHRLIAEAEGHASASVDADAGGSSVEIVLKPEAKILGTVVDESGHAVTNCRIQVIPAEPNPIFISPWATVTGGGRFEKRGLTSGSYALEVFPAEHVDKTVVDVKVEEGRTTDVGKIVLASGGSIRGVVVDSRGAPIIGAQLRAEEAVRRRSAYGGAAERVTVSDGAGRFELRGLPAGNARVVATHREFASSSAEVDIDPSATSAETRIAMFEGGRVQGTARGRDGKPVASAIVTVSNMVLGSGMNQSARVETNGTFVVEHVTAGQSEALLLVGAAGMYRDVLSKPVDVQEGATVNVDLTLADVVVSGRVTRGAKAVPDYRVTFSKPGGTSMLMGLSNAPSVPAPSSGPQRLTGITGADGTYQLLVPDTGKYDVRIQSIGRKKAGIPNLPAAVVADGETFTHDIHMPGGVLTGRVIAKEGGAPLRAATVEAQPDNGEPGGARTTASADGRFRLVLEAGSYRMRVGAPKHMTEEMPLTLGDSETVRTFALEQGAEITGSVRNRAGDGIAAARIIAVPPDMTGARVAHSITDGSFTLDGLRDARYALLAAHPESGFAFQPGASIGDIAPLTLNPGAKVRFRIKDANGAPLPETYVRIDMIRVDGARVGVELGGSWGNARHTDADGSFEWLVPIGTVDLVAWATEQKLRADIHLDVQPGTGDVTVVLKPRP